MKAMRGFTAVSAAILACLLPREAGAVVTVYFNPSQVATLVENGTTWDTFSCEGYVFTCTRDKLFTGGGTNPIGRPIRVQWPDGIEAQYVTAGPNPTKAQILVRRVDGGIFDLTSFTAKLLANAGAGRAIEIVPLLNGAEPLNDPLYFDVSGNYGMEFSYDTSPNPLGSTAGLVNYDAYKINLTLDYSLTALTLTDPSATAVYPDPRTLTTSRILLSPNPAGSRVQIRLSDASSVEERLISVFSATGSRVCSLMLDPSGRATWNLRDDNGCPVAAGVYFMGMKSAARVLESPRVVIVR
ncbi:MAG: hypothetical protein HZB25_12470 [Candidatus Eisenbacteria bacterium]|nr:hypothetical protein [Candidatus Eisenbacteria bacterium]